MTWYLRRMSQDPKLSKFARRSLRVALVFGVLAGLGACGALRQNLRNEFVSYRGTWQCDKAGCKQAQMVRSKKAHRDGEINVAHVKIQPHVVMIFNAGAAPDSFSATLRCGGKSGPVPDARIKAPGRHKIAGQADSYALIVKRKDYAFAATCKDLRIVTHATWEGGKRTYEAEAGLKAL